MTDKDVVIETSQLQKENVELKEQVARLREIVLSANKVVVRLQ